MKNKGVATFLAEDDALDQQKLLAHVVVGLFRGWLQVAQRLPLLLCLDPDVGRKGLRPLCKGVVTPLRGDRDPLSKRVGKDIFRVIGLLADGSRWPSVSLSFLA